MESFGDILKDLLDFLRLCLINICDSVPIRIAFSLLTLFIISLLLPIILFSMTLLFHTLQMLDAKYKYLTIFKNALFNTIRILSVPFDKKKRKTLFVVTIFSIANMLLVIAGLEVNPGPNKKIKKYSFAVWNLDSIMARNKSKIPLIESLNAVYQYSLFGLCETYLTKDISDSEISISGFSPSPFRADCKDTEGKRKGGVCLFYNENLPIKQRLDFKTQIDETIVAEIQLKI